MSLQLFNGHSRVVASVAATLVALACGTNYVYSAWAPQFAERLELSSTQSNLVGLSGNLGVYSLGIPVGVLIDRRGPRAFVLFGAALLAAGYFSLHQAYDSSSGSIATLCFFSYLSGLGSCMAFAAAVKTSALNWPHHRGTATAFPVAAFGLSAFFFSSLGSILFHGDPSAFLKLLSWGTFGLTFVGFFFLTVSSHAVDSSHQGDGPASSEPRFHRLPSAEAESIHPRHHALPATESDVRGLRLLRSQSFWLLFSIMAILAGTGLMTINNIGNSANALWKHFDNTVSKSFLVRNQQMHVSILSVCSFIGRLLSGKPPYPSPCPPVLDRIAHSGDMLLGVGSDLMVKSLRLSRLWCLFVACSMILIAQMLALGIDNPHLLGFVSALSGLGYGFLFGVFPSLVTEAFGIRGLSQNWGFMMLAPVMSSNIFNLFYGATYDAHSAVGPDGKTSCRQGLDCYRAAYWISFGACCGGLMIVLQAIRHERLELARERDSRD